MFGFKRAKATDEELARQYVRRILEFGREVCPSVAEAIQTTTGGGVNFPVNARTDTEIALAILGTSLAILKDNSPIMDSARGSLVEGFCKQSIERDCHFSSELVSWAHSALNEYQRVYKQSLLKKTNPFGDVCGIMLCKCLGPHTKELCLPDTDSLNPFVHQFVGDVMTMAIIQAMAFWKGK